MGEKSATQRTTKIAAGEFPVAIGCRRSKELERSVMLKLRPSVAFRFVASCGHGNRCEIQKESGRCGAGPAGRIEGRQSAGKNADRSRTQGERTESSTSPVGEKEKNKKD